MLSAVIVAWNEEVALSRCLASLAGVVDEIVVVVDKATTDKTAQVAKAAGARVFFHEHTGIVEPMRNFALSKARGDWILLLDADEVVSGQLSHHLKKSLHTDASVIRLPRKNIIFGRWIRSGHWWPDYVYRLFKKGTVEWDAAIHSHPKVTGTVIDLPAEEEYALTHFNYQTISQFIDRLNRYTDFQSGPGRPFHWSDVITRPGQEFLSQYFARGGYKEGFHGLALSLLQAVSELVVVLKNWQGHGFPEIATNPRDLAPYARSFGKDLMWWVIDSELKTQSGIHRAVAKVRRRLHSPL